MNVSSMLQIIPCKTLSYPIYSNSFNTQRHISLSPLGSSEGQQGNMAPRKMSDVEPEIHHG